MSPIVTDICCHVIFLCVKYRRCFAMKTLAQGVHKMHLAEKKKDIIHIMIMPE